MVGSHATHLVFVLFNACVYMIFLISGTNKETKMKVINDKDQYNCISLKFIKVPRAKVYQNNLMNVSYVQTVIYVLCFLPTTSHKIMFYL